MKVGKIILILILVALLAGLFYYSSNKNTMITEIPQITQEELAQGWYYGETKRPGTPDTWILRNAGTRGAQWMDSTAKATYHDKPADK